MENLTRNIQAEQSVLGAILLDESAYNRNRAVTKSRNV